jgi:hypothetical protein
MVVVALAYTVGRAAGQAPLRPLSPTVLSGDDIGFRVEAEQGGVAVGRLVVRIDGKWVEAELRGGVRRLTSTGGVGVRQ